MVGEKVDEMLEVSIKIDRSRVGIKVGWLVVFSKEDSFLLAGSGEDNKILFDLYFVVVIIRL